MTVLVTGGAGYIGAHVVAALKDRDIDVVVVDDLSSGRADRLGDTRLETIDLVSAGASDRLAEVMTDASVSAIIHFAAKKQVAESVERPLYYYQQNVGGLAAVLDGAAKAGVDRIVFSSTAAVYGPSEEPVDEASVTVPANPYGSSKLVGEWLMRDLADAGQLRAISLRYFNVAGAASAELADKGDSNVVPMVFSRLERGEPPLIFGDDYDTPDGTCVRDYIHVLDVADAHVEAVAALDDDAAERFRIYNIGTGTGTSVRELVETMTRVSGAEIAPRVVPRRPGDPAFVVADPSRMRRELGWSARHSLADALASAWAARRP